MSSHLAFVVFFLALLVVLWFTFIKPTLAQYRATAGITAQLAMREHSAWQWFVLQIEGLKSVILMLIVSFFTAASDLMQSALGLDPAALAPFQDPDLWKVIVAQQTALKAASIVTFGIALLTLKGKLKDVRTVPQAQPVIVPVGGTPTPGGQ